MLKSKLEEKIIHRAMLLVNKAFLSYYKESDDFHNYEDLTNFLAEGCALKNLAQDLGLLSKLKDNVVWSLFLDSLRTIEEKQNHYETKIHNRLSFSIDKNDKEAIKKAAEAFGMSTPPQAADVSIHLLQLQSYRPDRKIATIKLVREITKKGLKEALDLVEETNSGKKSIITRSTSRELLENMQREFAEIGAETLIF